MPSISPHTAKTIYQQISKQTPTPGVESNQQLYHINSFNANNKKRVSYFTSLNLAKKIGQTPTPVLPSRMPHYILNTDFKPPALSTSPKLISRSFPQFSEIFLNFSFFFPFLSFPYLTRGLARVPHASSPAALLAAGDLVCLVSSQFLLHPWPIQPSKPIGNTFGFRF